MYGTFSRESLEAFSKLAAESQGLSFRESGENSYDFTRCVRPDGSSYGTGGKCRKGTEQKVFASDKGIQTESSGGIIGGKLFSGAREKLHKQQVEDEAIKSLRGWKKRNILNNKKKALDVLKASESLYDLASQTFKSKGYDEANKVVHDMNYLAKGLVNALYGMSGVLPSHSERISEMTQQMHLWANNADGYVSSSTANL